jgi:hypothetical protein
LARSHLRGIWTAYMDSVQERPRTREAIPMRRRWWILVAVSKSGNDHVRPDLETTLAAELAPPEDAASLDTAPVSG